MQRANNCCSSSCWRMRCLFSFQTREKMMAPSLNLKGSRPDTSTKEMRKLRSFVSSLRCNEHSCTYILCITYFVVYKQSWEVLIKVLEFW
ncbi:hypothetical protein Syun_017364 [Stephania yunnanensis]|uniref:Uncharacterized protein n=1 Tax=Stephania yunnanensis TaxID=152371 RepID=A0AAP0J947_9MAGN